ncbi:MAG: translation initiation factor IF-2 [Lachnospiraceae bacterium]|nr:translation initiation factor IF-2 [Lachnospiraceae bacterium]
MAKMKIHEISKSLQAQGNDIKSADLIKILNENGFEAKSPNSSIEDAAIAFLIKEFSGAPKKKADTDVKKPEEKKTKEKKTEKVKPETKKPEADKVKPELKKADVEKSDIKADKEETPEKPDKVQTPDRKAGVEKTQNRNANREGNGNYSSRDGQKHYNNNKNDRNYRNDRNDKGDNRGNGQYDGQRQGGGQRSNNNNLRQGGGQRPQGQGSDKAFEKYKKSQSGFDSIKQEQKPGRTQRQAKDKKYNNKDKGMYDEDDMLRGKKGSQAKKKDPNRKGAFIKPEVVVKEESQDTIRTIIIPEKLTLRDLGDKMKVAPAQIVKKLFLKGQMVSINQEISFDEAEEIALEFNCIAELEEKVDVIAELLKENEDEESTLKKRPPVVCVMGHVDHGKTSLLDAIRNTNVISREAGGITQHIGAYMVTCNDEKITFLDTPGHEAFTSMRMRGAKSTDIAILVVAADDGVMPQTVEAISHAKAAQVEIIVAINKIDKPGANIDRVKQELVEHELIPEDWGGSTVFVPVSAKTGEGIENLLEMVLLTAEMLELKAAPDRNARGIVIEARLDKGRGPVATILVQKGTLKVGDHIVIGSSHGKVRAMMDDRGQRVKEATPSTPVEILGLHEVPDAGEVFLTTDTEKEARTIVDAYINQSKARLIEDTKSVMSLDGLFNQIQAGNIKELNLIVKADVQGSVEAVKQSLTKLSNEEVAIRIIHGGVGAINESDVSLAIASNAIIIGFNVRPDNMAKATADREKVDLRLYRVIYDAINDIESAMKGMLDPIYEEKVLGHAEVRQTFKASGLGTIAGSYVLDGKIERGCKARIYRGDEMIFEGNLASLKRFKDDVKEVNTGYECGLVFEGFSSIQVEDRVELYTMVEVPR